MFRHITLIAVVAALAIATYTLSLSKKSSTSRFKKVPKMDRIDLAMKQEYELTKDPALGIIPRDRLVEAARVRDEKLALLDNSRAVAGLAWQERGPSNVGGRTRALLYDASDAANGYKKVWAGSVAGGLWYTNDISASLPQWHRVNDFLGNLAITTIAQNPANTQELYVGTGEGWFNLDFVRGLGIWKSSDGGTTWSQLANTNNTSFHYVQKIVVTSTGVVIATTRDGVQRSTNGGTNWTKVLGAGVGGGISNRAADLEIAADGRVYASAGIFSSDGVYRSTDGGATWTNIYLSASDEQRLELACAPSDANVVYVLVHGANGSNGISGDGDDDGIKKIMRTANATAVTPTWSNLTLPTWCDGGTPGSTDFTRNQAWYDLIAAVDPANSNTVYVGGVDMMKTTNGGTSWTQISQWANGCSAGAYVHADIHNIIFKPGSSTELTVGCDGGIFQTMDAGVNFAHRNQGYNITQYYAAAIHPTTTNYFLAGAQDNGTQKYSAAGINTTVQATGGDGGFCHIDSDAPNTQITAYVFNNYFVSTDGGVNWTSRSFNNNGQFINPTDYDNTANILYAGNSGGTYLRWPNPASGVVTSNVTVPEFGTALITHVTVSPLTANRVYFGLDAGTLYRVDNANTNTSRTGVLMHTGTGPVSSISIDPGNEDHMLVTHSNYGVTSVYESFNATSATPTFTSVEGDLPDMPVRWAMFDPRNSDWALLATELGVWSTDNLNSAGTTNWNPTNASLSNVRVDMLQYRSADRTIAAATHGRGLFTAVVPASTTQAIRFSSASLTAGEQNAASATCRTYKDYTLNMVVEAPVTVASAVTVGIAGGNTATQGVDFDYTTNGSFSSPSTTINFAANTTTAQDILVRVYDDLSVEGSETFTLNFAINSGSVITGSINQTYAVTITDNDLSPTAAVVLNGSIGSNTASLQQPFRSDFQDARTQMIYTAEELYAAGLKKGTITQISFTVVSKGSTAPFNNFTVRMKNTTNDSLRIGNIFESGTTIVYGPIAYSTVVGANNIVLSSPFSWDGVSNLLVEVCFDNAAVSGADLVAATNGASKMQFARVNGTSGCAIPSATNTFATNPRPDISITMTATATPVESVLNATRTTYLGANADVYLYSSTDGELIARVRNLSSHDYGCTQVVVDRTGTGATAFWNNNPANYLMDKTIRIIPTINNPAGQFEVTLYYTQAEVNGWQAATGQTFSNIELIKVAGQINQVTPANPTGAGTVEVVTPTRSTLGTNSTLTFTFNTGMGGLGAGIPGLSALPVTLLHFTGQLQQQYTLLTWATTSEQNNRGFEIERSYDGVRFSKIGFVSSAGNSSTTRHYQFRDPQKAVEFNYYRLRIVDLDNSSTYSNIVLVKNPLSAQQIFVVSNPFRSDITLRFARIPKGTIGLHLFDMNGRKVYSSNATANGQLLTLPTGRMQLSSGTYMLRVEMEGEISTLRLIKQ